MNKKGRKKLVMGEIMLLTMWRARGQLLTRKSDYFCHNSTIDFLLPLNFCVEGFKTVISILNDHFEI